MLRSRALLLGISLVALSGCDFILNLDKLQWDGGNDVDGSDAGTTWADASTANLDGSAAPDSGAADASVAPDASASTPDGGCVSSCAVSGAICDESLSCSSATLNGVSGSASPSLDLWAVGEGEVMLKRDANGWRVHQGASGAPRLNGVWVNTPANAYAVGTSGLYQWDGQRWKAAGQPLTQELFGVWSDGATVALVGGWLNIATNSGGAWANVTNQYVPDYYGTTPYLAVWGRGNDRWAAGYMTSPAGAVTPQSDYWTSADFASANGVYAEPVDTFGHIRALWGNATDVYAATQQTPITTSGVVIHFVPGSPPTWAAMTMPANTFPLYGICGEGKDVWAVGEKGTVIRMVAGAWQAFDSGTNVNLRSCWAGGGQAWFVGENGTILHYTP